jgi:hypothetical protein
MVSGTFSLRCSRCFSPFPHGTCSLSVSCEYLALPDGPGCFKQDFSCPALLRILILHTKCTCTGLSPAMAQLSRWFHLFVCIKISPTTPTLPKQYWFGLFPFRSPLLRKSQLFSLPPVNEMFQFTGFASRLPGIPSLQLGGLPHSEIFGLQVICTYPKLIAAYHVLLRLQEPRHPPYALTILSFVFLLYVIFFIPTCQRTY